MAELFESAIGGTTSKYIQAGGGQLAQLFTPAVGHTIEYVELKVGRRNNPGNVKIGIYALDGADEPTGLALTEETVNGNLWPHWSTPDWETIIFTTQPTLSTDITYAIVLTIAGGNATNWVGWFDMGNIYDRGYVLNQQFGGGAWIHDTAYDMNFKEYGSGALVAKEIEAVNHIFLHKEIESKGHIFLSSLITGLSDIFFHHEVESLYPIVNAKEITGQYDIANPLTAKELEGKYAIFIHKEIEGRHPICVGSELQGRYSLSGWLEDTHADGWVEDDMPTDEWVEDKDFIPEGS